MEMTVREYLEFAAELKGIKKDKRESQIEEVIRLAKLRDVENRLIQNLSKGYRQRVGLAQALIGNPKVLILDEPTVGLDPKQIIEIRTLIRKLGKNHTVILSSHILSEVQAVCDKIIVINEGKVVANDTEEHLSQKLSGALYEQPAREKLWAGAFLCPAENYMTLVDFGQVKVTGGQQGSRSNSTRLYTIPGEPCRAPAGGVVVFAGDLALTGNTVVIDHGCGVRSYLYGLQELSVTRGQTVERGQAVGVLGEELTMDFKLGSKSINPWLLFQTSGGLFWKENG